jgi:hypothetical protein
MSSTYEPIATTTLGGTATSITFSSISSAYTDLVAVAAIASTTAPDDLTFRINGDTSSIYSATILFGTGSSAGSGRLTTRSSGIGSYYGTPNTVVNNSVQILNFMNYSNSTTYKTILVRANRSDSGVDAMVDLWRNTAAIDSITFGIGGSFSNTIAIGSTITLYGIKAE